MTTLNFKVQNSSGIPDDEVFIGFWGSELDAMIDGAQMKSIQDSAWYKLSGIESLVISVKTSGRFYVAYYDPFSPTASGGEPSIVAPNSPAYNRPILPATNVQPMCIHRRQFQPHNWRDGYRGGRY